MSGILAHMIEPVELTQLNETQLRDLAARLIDEVRFKQAAIDKLTHESQCRINTPQSCRLKFPQFCQ